MEDDDIQRMLVLRKLTRTITEISGTDAFEEIVNLDEISRIRDPLKEQLVELVKNGDAERYLASAK